MFSFETEGSTVTGTALIDHIRTGWPFLLFALTNVSVAKNLSFFSYIDSMVYYISSRRNDS